MEKQGKVKIKDWNTYYKTHNKVALSNILLHWQYLASIIWKRPKQILEIGCGPADHSVTIKKFYPFAKISLLDSDEKIIKKLKKQYKKMFQNYYICDITDKNAVDNLKLGKKQFDVVISQGLLEHFQEKELIQLITNFMPYTKKFIASIPSDHYPTHDFGNEILRDKKRIEQILAKIPYIKYQVKYYFPDIGIRTKLIKINLKKMSATDKIKFLTFGSCHLLVEISSK